MAVSCGGPCRETFNLSNGYQLCQLCSWTCCLKCFGVEQGTQAWPDSDNQYRATGVPGHTRGHGKSVDFATHSVIIGGPKQNSTMTLEDEAKRKGISIKHAKTRTTSSMLKPSEAGFKKEACCKRGHVMKLYESRWNGINWKCDACAAHYNASPGFKFYSCPGCDEDYCHNCFG